MLPNFTAQVPSGQNEVRHHISAPYQRTISAQPRLAGTPQRLAFVFTQRRTEVQHLVQDVAGFEVSLAAVEVHEPCGRETAFFVEHESNSLPRGIGCRLLWHVACPLGARSAPVPFRSPGVGLRQRLYAHDWVVYAKQPLGGPAPVGAKVITRRRPERRQISYPMLSAKVCNGLLCELKAGMTHRGA